MSTISASTTSTTGFKVTSDTTGTLVFQTGASPTTAMTISAAQIISFTNPPTATGGGGVSTNTAYGTSALGGGSQSGGFNSVFGYQAGLADTTGNGFVAVGYQSMLNNTTGSDSTAVGYQSLAANTTGGSNVAIGSRALYSNTTSGSNTAVGYQALYSNTTGTSSNEAFGREALKTNTTGGFNQAFGNSALFYNTTGSYNVAMGTGSLQSNTTASNNTAVGYQAGYTNTTGGLNVYIGRLAGYYSNGSSNTCVGEEAGYYALGSNNTYLGYGAGPQNGGSTGSYNTLIGNLSGYLITTGSKNSVLGCYNGNQGGLDIRTASNYIVLSDGDGNPRGYFVGGLAYSDFHINSGAGAQYSVLSFTIGGSGYVAQMYWDANTNRFQTYTNANGPYISQGSGSWTSSSDERLKNITGEIENGLSKVCALRAAKYHWKSDENAVPRVGLIAQDVLAVLPEAVEIPPEGSLDKEGNLAMMGVQYTEVIPLLVAAIKELKAEFEAYKEAHP